MNIANAGMVIGQFKMDSYSLKILTMKRLIIICGLTFLAIAFMSSFDKTQTSINGRIIPVDGANIAWAFSSKDSVSSNIVNGAFTFSVKPGIYRVMIDAIEPYKDATVENVSVKEGQTVDVGEIVLQR
jgi:hypothetical protein